MSRLNPVAATALGVVAITIAAAFAAPLVDRDEPRYALAVREMRASGDLLVPRNLGRLRADKPPLVYWFQLAAVATFGESEAALRLPSSVAAGALVLLTAGLARRLGADAVIAGTVVVPGAVLAGSLATPDALVVAFGALSLWGFLRAAEGLDRWESALLGWVALAAGILVKGPVAPLFVGCALIGLWRADRGVARRLGWWWGPWLVLVVVGAWFVPANLATDWELARVGLGRHVVGRALQPLEHHGLSGLLGILAGPPFYAAALLLVMFPVGLAPLAVWRRRRDLPPRLVGVALWGTVAPAVVLCAVATKLPHYILPALPLVVVSAAAVGRPRRWLGWCAGIAVLAGAVVLARSTPWRAAGEAVAAHGGALTVGLEEPSLIWAAQGTLHVTDEREILREASSRSVLALLRAETVTALSRSAPHLAIATLGRWQGLNLAKGRREDLRLVSLGPPPRTTSRSGVPAGGAGASGRPMS